MTLNVTIEGREEDLRRWAQIHGKHVDRVMAGAHAAISQSKRQILPWQAACLYALATHLDRHGGGEALEIGTARGYSAYFIARAMPHTRFTTLNPNVTETQLASAVLRPMRVEQRLALSWDYFEQDTRRYDFIFVDGDHKQILRDLPWFNRLRPNGLILFHDVSPAGSARACPPVYEGVLKLAHDLGRDPDVWLADEGQVGMAGFYRREGETWQTT